MRTIIDLPDEQIEQLASLSERERVSRAELIRRAVADYLKRMPRDETDAAFGIWRDRGEDALAYEDRLRDEWTR